MASKSNSRPPIGTLGSGVRAIILLLALLGTGLAAYLAWVSFSGRDAVGCGPDSGCAAVLNSRWAYWLGVPVSVLGGLTYVAIFAGTWRLTHRTSAAQQRRIWRFLLLAAWLVLGAALWFVVLQTVVIHQFCPFCMTAHGAALVAALLLLRHCPYGSEPAKAKDQERQVYVTPASVRKLFMPAAVGLALLAAGQVVAPRKTFVEQSLSGGVQITTNAAPATNLLTAQPPPAAIADTSAPPATTVTAAADSEFRSIALFDGKLQFDLVDVPILGRSDAPHVMIALHDYTCHSCRAMHRPLLDLFHKYSNQLAIVSLPMPLDSECNPLVNQTPSAHVNACEYAKISLAVWRARADLLPRFDDWVFAPERPPGLEETRRFARQLVGDQAFAAAWEDPLVERQLKINIALYGLNYQINRRGAMPQFFMGGNVLFGSMAFEALEQRVVQEFGLKPVP